jgi:hypothetical protein
VGRCYYFDIGSQFEAKMGNLDAECLLKLGESTRSSRARNYYLVSHVVGSVSHANHYDIHALASTERCDAPMWLS